MTWPSWIRRLWPYLGRRQAEADIEEELRLHLELERERQQGVGLSEADSLRAARRTLGNATLIRERTRDVWGWRWLDDLMRDLRHAVRSVQRSPGFACTVVMVAGLGIGANAAMFSIVYGMLIRPLAYPDADAIMRVGHVSSVRPNEWPVVSNLTFPRLQQGMDSFEQIAGYVPRSRVWLSPDGPRVVHGAMVSPSLFPLLRTSPHLGRLFVEEDTRDGAERVVLLSHSMWTNRYASDPGTIGASLELDGEAYSVVGILPESFSFPSSEEELWTPLVVPPFEPAGAVGLGFSALGRLRPGVSPQRAATEVRTVLNADRSPSAPGPRLRARVVPLQETMVDGFRPALLVLSAVTVLVLAIACINVTGLFLARGEARRRELGVRSALGAGRSRIVRQLMAESVLLGVSGGVVGFAFAVLVLRGAFALVPGDIPRLGDISVDGLVLAFSIGLAVVAGLIFGAVPALSWSRLGFLHPFKSGVPRMVRVSEFLSGGRTGAVLTIAQVALALVLLVGAGLLIRSFVGLLSLDPGYDADNVLTARVNHPELATQILTGEFDDAEEQARGFSETLRERLARVESLGAVEAVGLSTALPFVYGGSLTPVLAPGRPEPASPSDLPRARVQLVSPGYFEVMRLRMRGGRMLTRQDAVGGPRVAVVSESLERELFEGAAAVGRRLQLGSDDEPWEVVGVVADVKYQEVASAEPRPAVYIPMHRSGASPFPIVNTPFISVRTSGDPLATIPFLRQAVAEAHPGAALDDVATLETRLASSVAQPRFQTVFVASFGMVALLLAALGVYGLLSYLVNQRRTELGVRMALGAQAGNVVQLVFRRGAGVVAAGVGLGVLGAATSSRLLESVLFGVSSSDRLTFAVASLVVGTVALVACWLPARRATRVDPMDILRLE